MISLMDLIKIDLKYIFYPLLYILLGMISYTLLKKIVYKITSSNEKKLKSSQKQKLNTMRILMLNILKYGVVILVFLAILSVFGVNIKSILAGLGVTTVLLGLALQDLAKDFIAGISIITEGQYEVGDTIEVDGFMGEVVFVGLKTTRIRNYKGATKIIANHYMDNIINYSLHNSLAIVDVSTGYEHAPEEIEKVLNKLAKKLNGTIKEATGEIEILGIENLEDSGVIYRITLEVESMKQYIVERYLRKEVKKAFTEANIKIPYPQIEVHHGSK